MAGHRASSYKGLYHSGVGLIPKWCSERTTADIAAVPAQQRLVIGHLPALDLDMQKLFEAGLQPILTAQLAGHTTTCDLTVAMLSRLRLQIDSRGHGVCRLHLPHAL